MAVSDTPAFLCPHVDLGGVLTGNYYFVSARRLPETREIERQDGRVAGQLHARVMHLIS